MEIILAPSRIQTHRGRVMQLLKQELYLQAAIAYHKYVLIKQEWSRPASENVQCECENVQVV